VRAAKDGKAGDGFLIADAGEAALLWSRMAGTLSDGILFVWLL
jgi:hypothetical protein